MTDPMTRPGDVEADPMLEGIASAPCEDAQARGYDHGPHPTLVSFSPPYCPRHLGIASEVRASLAARAAHSPAQPVGEPVITEDPEADGSLDDLFIKGGIESFHIERMDTNIWWFAVYFADGSRHTFNLRSSRRIDADHHQEPSIRALAATPEDQS